MERLGLTPSREQSPNAHGEKGKEGIQRGRLHVLSTLLGGEVKSHRNLRNPHSGFPRRLHLWLEFVLRALDKSQGVGWGR